MGLAPYSKPEYSLKAYEIFKEGMYVDGINFKFHERPKDHYFDIKIGLKVYVSMQLLEDYKDMLKKYCLSILIMRLKYGKSKLVYSGGNNEHKS